MVKSLLLLLLSCLISTAIARQGKVGLDKRVGWIRRPLAVGVFGGYRVGKEPHLLEFHGTNCDHCEAMLPLMKKLRQIYRIKIKRHMVWEGTANFHLMAVLDSETGCKGLPFFYNRNTRQTICGATNWRNFRNWALDRPCIPFLPPAKTSEEEEDLKPKKLKKPNLVERLKAKATKSKKDSEETFSLGGYDE